MKFKSFNIFRTFIYFTLISFLLFSCGSYHNKIRKQAVDKKPRSQQIIVGETVKDRSVEARLEQADEQNNDADKIADEYKKSPSTKNDERLSDGKNLSNPQGGFQNNLPKNSIPTDTVYLDDQEILRQAKITEKKSQEAAIIIGVSLIPIFLISFVLLIFGIIFKVSAENREYNTQRGVKNLKNATIMMIISIILKILGILIVLALFGLL